VNTKDKVYKMMISSVFIPTNNHWSRQHIDIAWRYTIQISISTK